METKLLDGKFLRAKKYEELIPRVSALKARGINPHLAVIQVGEDAASSVYVGNKQKACEALGIKSTKIHLDSSITWETLVSEVQKLNNDPHVDGILVQFPLPKHLSKLSIANVIDPRKDADGIHPFNQGINLTKGSEFAPLPCTPNGVMEFFKAYNISLEGKDAVVVGRSNIVGRPMTYLLSNANATVTQVHTKTSKESFERAIKNADIIVTATGVADAITPDMVKRGVVIADVGIIRKEDGKLRGDVDYKAFEGIASYITPVPGGVGLMTVTMLMENVIRLAEEYRG